MPEVVKEKGFLALLLRGSLGGALGGFLWALVTVLTSIGFRQGWWYWLLLGYMYQGLPLGVIMGALVTTVLWLIARLRQVDSGLFTRFLIGSLIATMISWIAAWWSTQQGDFFPTPWHLDFLWIVFFGAATGGVGAIIAGARRTRSITDEKSDLDSKDTKQERELA